PILAFRANSEFPVTVLECEWRECRQVDLRPASLRLWVDIVRSREARRVQLLWLVLLWLLLLHHRLRDRLLPGGLLWRGVPPRLPRGGALRRFVVKGFLIVHVRDSVRPAVSEVISGLPHGTCDETGEQGPGRQHIQTKRPLRLRPIQ